MKKQRHYFADKGLSSQSFLIVMHVMWELDHKESWALKIWWFWTVVLEKTVESLLDCKEIKPVNPKGPQPWIFIERTDIEAEAPILGPSDAKNRLTEKDPDAGKDWRQEEKGRTEDEIAGWHPSLSGHEFAQASGVGDWQGSLACCSHCGCKDSDTTERLNCTELDFSPPGSSVHGISKQNYWSKLSFFPSGDLPSPGIKPASCISCIDRQLLYYAATLARTKSSATVSVIGN